MKAYELAAIAYGVPKSFVYIQCIVEQYAKEQEAILKLRMLGVSEEECNLMLVKFTKEAYQQCAFSNHEYIINTLANEYLKFLST